jgi:hypothetical protein
VRYERGVDTYALYRDIAGRTLSPVGDERWTLLAAPSGTANPADAVVRWFGEQTGQA